MVPTGTSSLQSPPDTTGVPPDLGTGVRPRSNLELQIGSTLGLHLFRLFPLTVCAEGRTSTRTCVPTGAQRSVALGYNPSKTPKSETSRSSTDQDVRSHSVTIQ